MRRKKPLKDTAEYSKFLLARAFTEEYSHLMYQEATFEHYLLSDFFSIDRPLTSHPGASEHSDIVIMHSVRVFDRKRSEWQNRVNRILAQRGLYLTSNKGRYYIKNKPQTKTKIAQFLQDAAHKTLRSRELKKGLKKYDGVYSRVTDAEILKIVSGLKGAHGGGQTTGTPPTT